MGCLCNYLQLSDDHDAMLEVGQPRGYSVGMDPGRFIAMCGGAFSRGLGGDPGVFVSEWEERGQKTEYFGTLWLLYDNRIKIPEIIISKWVFIQWWIYHFVIGFIYK